MGKEKIDEEKFLQVEKKREIEEKNRREQMKIERIEFPTQEHPRGYGESQFAIWPTGKKLLAYLWFELFRKD